MGSQEVKNHYPVKHSLPGMQCSLNWNPGHEAGRVGSRHFIKFPVSLGGFWMENRHSHQTEGQDVRTGTPLLQSALSLQSDVTLDEY